MVDRARVQRLVRELLEAIGEDPNRDGLVETPRRVADMYVELFEGIEADPGEHLRVTFDAGHDEMVMLRDIAFTSLCEHHLVPFVGFAHVAYLPGRAATSPVSPNWPGWSRASRAACRSKSA